MECECGSQILPERVELGYNYCTKPDCVKKHRRAPVITAVAVNKSADVFIVADEEEIKRRAADGQFGKKNSTLGLYRREDHGSRPAEPSRRAPQPRRQAPARRDPGTPQQRKLVEAYLEMGLSPREMAERAPKVLTVGLATTIALNTRKK